MVYFKSLSGCSHPGKEVPCIPNVDVYGRHLRDSTVLHYILISAVAGCAQSGKCQTFPTNMIKKRNLVENITL